MKNKRLEKVLSFIEPNDSLADVGCDHGYLALEAIKKGVKKVLLIDNKVGPLNSAKENLKYIKSDIKVEYSLSSGISNINKETTTVAICGMGGELIVQILEADFEKAKKVNKFILQANSKIDYLRKYLFDNQFEIFNEAIVEDNNKTYEIIVTRFVGKKIEYDATDVLFGPCLKNEQSITFKNKWHRKLEYNKKIISSTKNEDIEKEIILIEEVLYENIKNS